MKSSYTLFTLMFLNVILCSQNVPDLIHYKFDGFDSTVINHASSPVGNNPAVLHGNQTQGSSGQFGSALDCSGGSSSTNYLDIGWNPNVGTGDWTISVWLGGTIPTILTNYIFGETSTNFRCFTGGTAGTGLYFRGGGMNDLLLSGSLFTTPKVITFVYDSSASSVYAYVNGVITSTQAQTGTVNITGTSAFRVGGYGFNNFTGLIDEFRFWSRALDSTEVQKVWNHRLPLPYGQNNAGISNLISPRKGCEGSQEVHVEVTNYGMNQIDTVLIQWSVNGIMQTSHLHTQLLDTLNGFGNQIDTIHIGNTTFVNGRIDTIKFWTSMPNNMPDTINGNDTMVFRIGGIPTPVLNLGNDTTICVGNQVTLDAGNGRDKIVWYNNSTNKLLNTDTAGTYWVSVKEGGCWSSDTIHIDTLNAPSILLKANPSNVICYGTPYTITASAKTSGSKSFQWIVNGIIVAGQTNDSVFNDTLKYGDEISALLYTNQCSQSTYAVSSNFIIMYINPEPQLINGVKTRDTVIENGNKTYSIADNPGHTYLWKVNGGVIQGDSTLDSVLVQWNGPTSKASISVIETDTATCSYTNRLDVSVISIVGVQERNDGNYSIYPNPNSGTFIIEFDTEESGTIQIHNSIGKKVLETQINQHRTIKIQLPSSIKRGIYIVRFILEQRTFTKKIIIVRD